VSTACAAARAMLSQTQTVKHPVEADLEADLAAVAAVTAVAVAALEAAKMDHLVVAVAALAAA